MAIEAGARMITNPATGETGADSSAVAAETSERNGCRITLRRFDGPDASELFLHAYSLADTADAGREADAVYGAIADVLADEGASFDAVVAETVFIRNMAESIESVRESRDRVL